MKVAKNISDGIDFGRSLGGGVAYIYICIFTYKCRYRYRLHVSQFAVCGTSLVRAGCLNLQGNFRGLATAAGNLKSSVYPA